MRRYLLLLLKIATSVALLYLSFRSIDMSRLGERLSGLRVQWIGVALVLTVAQLSLAAARWRAIAGVCGFQVRYGAVLKFSFIAMFFNQVLPSTVGGDAARIWFLARKGAGWAAAAYSVLIDRVAGVLALALLVIVCLPWSLTLITDPVARWVIILIGAGAVCGFLVFLAIGLTPHAWVDRVAPLRHLMVSSRKAQQLYKNPRTAALVMASSLAIQLLNVAIAWACANAIMAATGFAPLLFLFPPVLLVATVPISIAGWGVRESSMIIAFGYAGLAASDGLTLSILYGGVNFIAGMLGGAFWIWDGPRHRPGAANDLKQAD
jgi:uncharacterized protein (TIRG00374 family)